MPVLNPDCGIALVTDGSCFSGDRIGGWAYIALDAHDGVVEASGAEEDTTISRMELQAVASGLEEIFFFYDACDVLVLSDSQYVVLGATHKTRARRKNVDMWNWLDEFESKHKSVTYEHIRGHEDSVWNIRADELAGEARVARRTQAVPED